jgi:putative DNA primase/helicase
MRAWAEEACEPAKNAFERQSDLYASWKAFAERSGEQGGSSKRFSQNLARYGFEKVKNSQGRGFRGMKLIQATATQHGE